MTNQRNSSIELLRLVLMLMITIHHCIVHGLGMVGLSNENVTVLIPEGQMMLMLTAEGFLLCAVNCFVLISGYFGIKVTWKKLFSLFFVVLFYTLLLTSIPWLCEGRTKTALAHTLIISHPQYWFIKCYILLMAFAPLINAAFERLSEWQIRGVLGAFIMITIYLGFIWNASPNASGYTLMQFVTIYCVGRYIRMHDFQMKPCTAFIGYLSASLLLAVAMCAFHLLPLGFSPWRLFGYNNPLIIISAIYLFMFFKDVEMKSRIVNALSLSALPIYLVQESKLGCDLFYPAVKHLCTSKLGGVNLLLIIGLSISLMAVVLTFDRLRIYLSNHTLSYIDKLASHHQNQKQV